MPYVKKFIVFQFVIILITLFPSFVNGQDITVINHYGDTTGLGADAQFFLNDFTQHTLLINYYKPVASEEVGRLERLIGNALNYYVDNLVRLEGDLVVIEKGDKQIVKELNSIVSDGIRFYSYRALEKFPGFSEQVYSKLKMIRSIDLTSIVSNSNEDQNRVKHYLVQKELNDLKLILNTEIGNFGNNNIMVLSQAENVDVISKAQDELLSSIHNFNQYDPLDQIEVELSPSTIAILSPKDNSSLEDESNYYNLLFDMLKANNDRLDSLQNQINRMNDAQDLGLQLQINELRDAISSLLQSRPSNEFSGSSQVENLPEKITLTFSNGGSSLNLGQKYILNELFEVMAFHPRLRVVITGFADHTGLATSNLLLSKKRAKNVRDFLLGRGIDDNRMVMNFFGDKYATNTRVSDRKVEVTFFAY